MVLEDVTELYVLLYTEQEHCSKRADQYISDYTGAQTKLPKILLNGNNICMVRDDGRPVKFQPANYSHSSLYQEACRRATMNERSKMRMAKTKTTSR